MKFTPFEIGAALGKICRYGGRGKYCSVLIHSLVVAALLPPAIALHGLLHDASETVIGEVCAPHKPAALKAEEEQILKEIYRDLNVPFPSDETRALVKSADNKSRNAEIWTGWGDTVLQAQYSERDQRAEDLTRELSERFPPEEQIRLDGGAPREFVRQFYLYRSQLEN